MTSLFYPLYEFTHTMQSIDFNVLAKPEQSGVLPLSFFPTPPCLFVLLGFALFVFCSMVMLISAFDFQILARTLHFLKSE